MSREQEQERIARLREAVKQTKIAYQEPRTAFELLAKDLALQHPDSGYAMRPALRRENRTLLDYRRAVNRLRRLILDGKLPDESD